MPSYRAAVIQAFAPLLTYSGLYLCYGDKFHARHSCATSHFFGGALFLPPPDGLLVLLFVGQPAGFGPLLGGIGAGRPPPPLFPPLALLIKLSLSIKI